jgi:hypothetical protein
MEEVLESSIPQVIWATLPDLNFEGTCFPCSSHPEQLNYFSLVDGSLSGFSQPAMTPKSLN